MGGSGGFVVEEVENRPGYAGFFRISVRRIRHSRFDGGMSRVLTREVFERGDAVAVLPYDPRKDTVLLIEQFLPGAYAGGRPARPFQVVAGMVDKVNEGSEDVARREAAEEAGIGMGRIVPALAFLPSPGGSSERVETFVAEADLTAAGGVHGLAEEDEDIRATVMPADDAIAMLDRGEIEAGPAVVALSWFARHRTRLRAEWLGQDPTSHRFNYRLADGREGVAELATGTYVTAAAALPGVLGIEPGDFPMQVEIWVPHLVDAGYGPYRYVVETPGGGAVALAMDPVRD